MRGVNCTIPHKINVIQYLDELSESARLIGAVNTIVNNGGRLFGEREALVRLRARLRAQRARRAA